MTVTKRQVLKAIQTEPILPGSFVHTANINAKRYKNSVHCPVCAVGAIFSHTSKKGVDAESVDALARNTVMQYTFDDRSTYYDGSLKELLKEAEKIVERHPLSALSSLFEALGNQDRYTTSKGFANLRLRRILAAFVTEYFPEKLVLDTDSKLY
jgi:hypothetical protein